MMMRTKFLDVPMDARDGATSGAPRRFSEGAMDALKAAQDAEKARALASAKAEAESKLKAKVNDAAAAAFARDPVGNLPNIGHVYPRATMIASALAVVVAGVVLWRVLKR